MWPNQAWGLWGVGCLKRYLYNLSTISDSRGKVVYLRLWERGLMSGERTPLELLLLLGMSASSASTGGVPLSLLSYCWRDLDSEDGVAGEWSGVTGAPRCSRSCDEYCDWHSTLSVFNIIAIIVCQDLNVCVCVCWTEQPWEEPSRFTDCMQHHTRTCW